MPKFQPGQSGNPSGRQGARQAVQRLLSPHLEQVAETVLAKALQGDVQASCAILDLYSVTMPKPRPPAA